LVLYSLKIYVGPILMSSAAFRQQKQLVYGTLESQNDLQRAIVQVSNDVKSAEAVRPFSAQLLLHSTTLSKFHNSSSHQTAWHGERRFDVDRFSLHRLALLGELSWCSGMYSPPPRLKTTIKSLRPIIRKSEIGRRRSTALSRYLG